MIVVSVEYRHAPEAKFPAQHEDAAAAYSLGARQYVALAGERAGGNLAVATTLRSAGVRVEQRAFEGVTHEFFSMGMVVRGADEANRYAVERLKAAFRN